jgi:predicted secreted hydrolase
VTRYADVSAGRPALAKTAVAAVAVGMGLVATWIAPGHGSTRGRPQGETARLELGPALDTSGFARVTAPRPYRLPADHGPHFEYQTEWWYYTGNLEATDGRSYGFQLTFFRRGLTPGPPPTTPGLATNQVYFAHLALTDVANGTHAFTERWCRGAGGLAGARGEPFVVWLEDWRVEGLNADGSAVRLAAHDDALGLDLELGLEALKPLARHGDRGVSAKSAEPGNASYYVGYTRLSARGRLRSGRHSAEVSGQAWFDHEWSTSALGEGAEGWDWFSLQLDDGRELMYFQIRREDGGLEAVSGGTLVERDGTTRRLGKDDVVVAVLDRWTSPETGAAYPARWRLRVPMEDLDLLVVPRVADQEMRTSFVYWEGSVSVAVTRRGRPLKGRGYVELTGYARSMQGVF